MPIWMMGKTAKIIAILVLIAAILFGVNRYNESQRDAGRAECRAAVAVATNAALERNRQLEAAYNIETTALAGKLNKMVGELDVEKTKRIAAVRDGTLKLRDANGTCRSTGPTVTTSTSGDSQATGCELSGATSEFLITEAARADEVVLQLKAAQELLAVDRKMINGGN